MPLADVPEVPRNTPEAVPTTKSIQFPPRHQDDAPSMFTADRRSLDHRSILEVLALENLVAAGQAVAFGTQRVDGVVARDQHVVELPDRTVAVHARHRVVDVQLARHRLGPNDGPAV